MSTYVEGIIPADEKYKKMKIIYENCMEYGIPVPQEVEEYFDDQKPDDEGIIVDIPYDQFENSDLCGISVDVENIPKDVKTLRFCNEW